jgi:hypothetical protein
MPTHIEYVQEKELSDMFQKCLNSDLMFAPLIENNVVIEPVLCVRMDENQEEIEPKGEVLKLKKMPEEFRLLVESRPNYVLVVDNHFWKKSDDRTRNAEMFRYLSRIEVVVKDDGVKLKTRPWDFQDMACVIKRFGPYSPRVSGFFEAAGLRHTLLTAVAGAVQAGKAIQAGKSAAQDETPAAEEAPEQDEAPSRPKGKSKSAEDSDENYLSRRVVNAAKAQPKAKGEEAEDAAPNADEDEDEEEKPRVLARPVPRRNKPVLVGDPEPED